MLWSLSAARLTVEGSQCRRAATSRIVGGSVPGASAHSVPATDAGTPNSPSTWATTASAAFPTSTRTRTISAFRSTSAGRVVGAVASRFTVTNPWYPPNVNEKLNEYGAVHDGKSPGRVGARHGWN